LNLWEQLRKAVAQSNFNNKEAGAHTSNDAMKSFDGEESPRYRHSDLAVVVM
jgi:hypothetical protein